MWYARLGSVWKLHAKRQNVQSDNKAAVKAFIAGWWLDGWFNYMFYFYVSFHEITVLI